MKGSALLTGGEKLNVPLTGPVSFDGFMLLGPAVLIVLRVYLQIYAEHQRRLDRIAQLIPAARPPLLTPDKNPLLRSFRGFAFYLLLPLALLAFWWKAAVFPEWGLAFAIVAAAIITMHLTLLFHWLSWNRRAVITLGVTTLVMAATVSFGISVRRPFNLFRANLADQWLVSVDLKDANLGNANLTRANLGDANLIGANLTRANLTGAYLGGANLTDAGLLLANLTRAYLFRANLTGANLTRAELDAANLTRADLTDANLTGANLTRTNLTDANLDRANLFGAYLTGANLTGANLTRAALDGANELVQEQLDRACGDAQTRLPAGLSVKFCSEH